MDIEKRMESVVESWKKKSELMPLTLKPSYEMLDSNGENFTESSSALVEHIFRSMLYLSLDVAMETMNKEIKKGIMKMDWDSDLSFIGKYLTDLYDSDGDMVQE